MATDKFKALALECAALPDDGLLTLFSGDVDVLEGDRTRDIMGRLAYASRRSWNPAETAILAPFLREFREGPLDRQAALLDLALAPPSLTLPNDLVNVWPLSESGDDEFGTSHLTNNNGVTFVPVVGLRGRLANFIRTNSQHLSNASIGNALNWALGFSVAGWFRFTDPGFAGTFFSIGVPVSAGGTGSFALGSSGVPGWMFAGCQGGMPIVNAGTTDAGAAGDGELHFVVATYDGTDSLVRQYVDGVLVGTSPNPTSGHPVTTGSAALLALGAVIPDTSLVASGFTSQQWGRFGIWNKALTLGEIASLMNSGNGKLFSELTAADKVGLVSYYNLNETSGARADSMGFFPLADNNTVGSVIDVPLNMPATCANFVAASSQSLSLNAISPAALGVADQFSISFWAKATTNMVGALGTVIAYDQSPNRNLWLGLILAGLNPQFYVMHPSPQAVTGPAAAFGSWFHVVAWRDATSLGLQVNGVTSLNLHGGSDANGGTCDFVIGRPEVAAGPAFDGQLSSLYLAARAWTANERAYLWNLGRGGFFPFPPLIPV